MKLTPKKNGKGYVTSYTVTIGTAEARKAGLVDEDGILREIEKIISDGKIIIVKKEPSV